MTKTEFIKLLEAPVKAAKENIASLDLAFIDDDLYVVATSLNGTKRNICVETDNLMALAYDVIVTLMYKD